MNILLKKIWRLFALNWSVSLQYRGDLFLWLLTVAITPLISMALWYAVAKNASSGPTPDETITYYVLAIIVSVATSAWDGFFLSQEILRGDIVQRLIKPVPPFWGFITANLSGKVLQFSILLPILAFILAAFPGSLSALTRNPLNWLLFFSSLVLAMILAFTLDMAFGLIAFWLEDAAQLRWYKETLQMITSGILIPIAVMPKSAQVFANILPFRSILTTPIEIVTDRLDPQQLTYAFSTQLIWIVIITGAMVIMWRQGLKTYAPPGQ